jgi:hypothetical protein
MNTMTMFWENTKGSRKLLTYFNNHDAIWVCGGAMKFVNTGARVN